MKIKICGVSEKQNLEELIKLKPNLLGFIFYPASPRYMAEKLSPEDLLIIPRSIKRVGVFVNADIYNIDGIYWKYNLDFVQLHGNESPAFCKNLNASGINIIKAFRVNDDFKFDGLMDYMPYCKYFLFDNDSVYYGGSGEKFSWKILENYKAGHPFFLSGGIGPYDAENLLELSHASFEGADLNSRFEISAGIKNIEELDKFLKKLRK